MADYTSPVDYQGTTYTPYSSDVGGLLQRKWDSLFVADDEIKRRNEDYYRARRGVEADGILNSPANLGGMTVTDRTGGVLGVTPNYLMSGGIREGDLPKGMIATQTPQSYSQQQLAQLSTIPGYDAVARQMMVKQAQEDQARTAQGWSVNPASNQAQENQRAIDRAKSDAEQLVQQNRRADAQLGIQQAQENRANIDWNSKNYLMENGILNPAGQMPAGIKPEDYISIQQANDRAQTAVDVRDYVNNSQAGRKITNPSEQQLVQSAWTGVILPEMQKKFQAGAMQQGELELFQKLAGDPTKWFNLNDGDRKIVNMWATEIENSADTMNRAYGVKPMQRQVGGSAFSKALMAGRKQGQLTPDYQPYMGP